MGERRIPSGTPLSWGDVSRSGVETVENTKSEEGV
jgi:hypothetical protein